MGLRNENGEQSARRFVGHPHKTTADDGNMQKKYLTID